MNEGERERESVCVCVCAVWCVSVCVCVCVCVSVYEREREREREGWRKREWFQVCISVMLCHEKLLFAGTSAANHEPQCMHKCTYRYQFQEYGCRKSNSLIW